MKTRVVNLFPLALMMLLAALTFWLQKTVQTPSSASSATIRHDPDFIVDHFTVTRYNALGSTESTLTALKMVHYPDDDTTYLDLPRSASFSPDAAPTHITANQGKLSKDGDQAYFQGDVVVQREASAEQPSLRITTEYLQVNQKNNSAHTDAPVVIVQGTSRLTGVGMDANKLDQTFQLRSQVRGSFERK